MVEFKEIVATFKEIWPEALGTWACFGTSFTCFPALLMTMSWFELKDPWMSVLVVGLYNSFDTIGRLLTSRLPMPEKRTLRIVTFSRISMIILCSMSLPGFKIPYL